MLSRVRHLKKDDLVVALSGAFKGKTGKVLEVRQSLGVIRVDGIGVVKRHSKPSQTNQKGGIVEKNKWLPACKFQVCSTGGKGLGRVGFVEKNGKKERVFSKERVAKK